MATTDFCWGKKSKSVFDFLTYLKETWFAVSYGKCLMVILVLQHERNEKQKTKSNFCMFFKNASSRRAKSKRNDTEQNRNGQQKCEKRERHRERK